MYVGVCMCPCVCCLTADARGCVGVHVGVCACGGQWSVSSVLLNHKPSYLFSDRFPVNMEFTDLAGMAGQ